MVLDLHGVRLAEARPLVLRVVAEAARQGRAQVCLIHGSSTADPEGARPTIKRMLHEMLETGALRRTSRRRSRCRLNCYWPWI